MPKNCSLYFKIRQKIKSNANRDFSVAKKCREISVPRAACAFQSDERAELNCEVSRKQKSAQEI